MSPQQGQDARITGVASAEASGKVDLSGSAEVSLNDPNTLSGLRDIGKSYRTAIGNLATSLFSNLLKSGDIAIGYLATRVTDFSAIKKDVQNLKTFANQKISDAKEYCHQKYAEKKEAKISAMLNSDFKSLTAVANSIQDDLIRKLVSEKIANSIQVAIKTARTEMTEYKEKHGINPVAELQETRKILFKGLEAMTNSFKAIDSIQDPTLRNELKMKLNRTINGSFQAVKNAYDQEEVKNITALAKHSETMLQAVSVLSNDMLSTVKMVNSVAQEKSLSLNVASVAEEAKSVFDKLAQSLATKLKDGHLSYLERKTLENEVLYPEQKIATAHIAEKVKASHRVDKAAGKLESILEQYSEDERALLLKRFTQKA
jgi:hypothetical protein